MGESLARILPLSIKATFVFPPSPLPLCFFLVLYDQSGNILDSMEARNPPTVL
jgi:hypothetical protein